MTNGKVFIALLFSACFAGEKKGHCSSLDSSGRFSLHFQLTTIDQWHGSFHSPYEGFHSLSPHEEQDMSLTSTLYTGVRLWKYGELYFNPEVAGGRGFSGATGIAGFTNGEIYRVGDPTPTAYVARIYWTQYIALKGTKNECIYDASNQVKDSIPDKCIKLTIGKYCLADFFDANTYSHDPRTQFINWSTMSNGAWDYPANTRGYTYSTIIGYQSKSFSVQACVALEPTYANGPTMDWNIDKTLGMAAEVTYSFNRKVAANNKHNFLPADKHYIEKSGGIRLLLFNNITRGGNYEQIITDYKNGLTDTLNVNSPTAYNGNRKYGIGLSFDIPLTEDIGIFSRIGWNDGHTATWAYTEIDETAMIGIAFNNILPKKKFENTFGICAVVNGISQQHQDFLNAGGYGFIVGDGKLPNYSPEFIGEAYYNIRLTENIAFAVDYQYVQNPGYNPDRGPVSAVLSGRVHISF